MPTIPEVLQHAVQLQNRGQLAEATRLYEAVLKVDPVQADALHLLGLIANAQKQYQKAVELIQQAISVSPPSAVFYGNLGVALRFAGRIDEAIEAYRQAISLAPDAPDTQFNYGKALKLSGDLAGAKDAFERAIELAPNRVSPWLSLMNLAAEAGDISLAAELGEKALQHCPASAELHMNLGIMYKRQGQLIRAVEFLNRSVSLSPKNIEALCKLSTTLFSMHRIEEGRQFLQRAHQIEPENVHVLVGFGVLHNTTGNAVLAESAYRRAVELYPSHGNAHTNLGVALKSQGKLSEALDCITRGIELEPDSAETLVNRGAVLMSLGRLQESKECFREAIELKHGYDDADDSLLMCLQYDPSVTAEELLVAHRNWDKRYCSGIAIAKRGSSARTSSRIRLGFVSPDLGNHPVGYFTVGMFENLDRTRFESFVYSDRIGDDPITQRIRKAADQWYQTTELSHEKLAGKIQQDQIDILFDLAGHTAHNRLLTFARRPAPIQISWAGYVGTTGLDSMDYLLADRFHVPEGYERLHCEKILRMPDDYICFDPPSEAGPVGPSPALDNGFVRFGCMANPAKVNEKVLALWGRILQALPDCQLLLCYCGWTDPDNQLRVRRILEKYKAAERVQFDYQTGRANLLARYSDIDIALDTFPYSGGLTTCEALWMGVPTVTLPLDRFASRHSYSHMQNANYKQFCCENDGQYLERAVHWARNLTDLQHIRQNMRSQVVESPLCDAVRFTRGFENVIAAISK
ncbi:MAG: tetratricopeptide repeat protein [Planctomycetales bacterium]|nr:tetratricopeptide repeat protein [Planctomycetales bacterium]